MRRSTLRTRLALLVTLIVAVTLALALTVAYGIADQRLDSQLNDSVHQQAQRLTETLSAAKPTSAGAALTLARADSKSLPIERSSTLLFLLIPGVGRASNGASLFGHSVLDNPHVGLHTFSVANAGLLRTDEIATVIAGRRAYVGAGESLLTTRSSEHQLIVAFAIAGSAALLLAFIAALALARRVVAPIATISTLATEVDGGDLTPRVALPDHTSDEIKALGDSFNRMLDRLTHAFSAQREFVADASHELRTPLTVIRGQLDLLSGDQPADPDEIVRIRALIDAEITRITRLVDDLLLLAQSERDDFLRPSRVDLPELATEIWDGLSLLAPRNFELGTLAPVSLVADPDRLAQALRNLGRNAIAHTKSPDGLVRIDIELIGSTANPGAATNPGAPTSPGARITVSDDGPGISPDKREQVFERFARLDPARTRNEGGAGLGLAIVRAIVTAHGGAVSVTERPGGGAAFVVDLPPDASNAGGPAGPPAHR